MISAPAVTARLLTWRVALARRLIVVVLSVTAPRTLAVMAP
jgi:hypothetical protein